MILKVLLDSLLILFYVDVKKKRLPYTPPPRQPLKSFSCNQPFLYLVSIYVTAVLFHTLGIQLSLSLSLSLSQFSFRREIFFFFFSRQCFIYLLIYFVDRV